MTPDAAWASLLTHLTPQEPLFPDDEASLDAIDQITDDAEMKQFQPADDEVVFPLSVHGRPASAETATGQCTRRLLNALKEHADCLRRVRSTLADVNRMLELGRSIGSRQPAKRATDKRLDNVLRALNHGVDALTRESHEANGAVEGLRKAFILDVSEGVCPPLLYSRALRYGLAVPAVCGTCGSEIGTEDVLLPSETIAKFIYKTRWPNSTDMP